MADYLSRALVADALAEWREQLGAHSATSGLRDLAAPTAHTFGLKGAHPSGLAQLFAHRSTWLSTLIRDPDHFAVALAAGKAIVATSEDLAAATGRWAAALAVGTVTVKGKEVPLLLRSLGVEAPRDRDIALTLRHDVALNPVFASALRELDALGPIEALVPATMEGKEFDPRPVWRAVRELADRLGDGFELSERLVVGAFDDPEQRLLDDLDELDAFVSGSEVIAAIAGDASAAASLGAPLPAIRAADRDPFGERGIGALDDSTFAVLDAVALGRSMLVQAPPGSDVVGAVAAMAADAAASGRVIAVVGGDEQTLHGIHDRLATLGAGDLVLSGLGDAWNAQANAAILESLTLAPAQFDEDELRLVGDEAIRSRSRVAALLESLHRPQRPWGVSAFDAIQAIVRLTTSGQQPTTMARLGPDVAAVMADKGAARVAAAVIARIHGEAQNEAQTEAQGGSQTEAMAAAPADVAAPEPAPAPRVPWWHRIAESEEQGAGWDLAVSQLVAGLLACRNDAAAASADCGVDEAANLRTWRDQVELFALVRDTLDVFTPDVFHRSLSDLVTATALVGAGEEPAMPRSLRRALTRRALDLTRPGRDHSTLHADLAAAAEQSDRWRKHASDGGWPAVPDDFEAFAVRVHKVDSAIRALGPALVRGTGFESLDEVPWGEAIDVLERLGEGVEASLADLPPDPEAIDLDAPGFAPLLKAVEAAKASPAQIRVDVEFAWWAAAFDSMASQDQRLLDQSALREGAERFLELDSLMSELRVGPVMRAAADRRRRAIAAHPADARDLFATLIGGANIGVRELLGEVGSVAFALRPAVITMHDHVAHMLPARRCLDVIVLVGAESLAMAQVIPALARASQVVLVADPGRATKSAVTQLAALLPSVALRAQPSSRDVRVAQVLAEAGYGRAIPAVPLPGGTQPEALKASLVAAQGAAAVGQSGVLGTQAEALAVAEHSIRSARVGNTVAVVACSDEQAQRVGAALIANDPFFGASVTVTTLGEAASIAADEVVISLGFAKDHVGKLPADLGVLSGPRGAAALAQAVLVGSTLTTVFASLDPGELTAIAANSQAGHGVAAFRELMVAAELPALPPERATPGSGDWLLADIGRLLRAQGLEVKLRHGLPGQTIPLAVGPAGGPLRVAVVTDAPADLPRGSLRDRLRWQFTALEPLGWTVVTLWTPEAFMDPAGAAARIAAAVEPAPGVLADVATGAIEPDDIGPADIEPAPAGEPDDLPEPQENNVTVENSPTEQPDVDQPASAEAPAVADEPAVVEEPAAEEPAAEEPAAAQPRPRMSPITAETARPITRGTERPLIPTRAWEDDDAAWGDRPSDRDSDIKRDKPPHW